MLLLLSLVALALAPLLLALARSSPRSLQLLDGFVFVAIGGLVVLHLLPEAFARGGWWVLLAGALGMLAPTFVEARLVNSARRAHMAALVLACIGLCLHGLLDGWVLAEAAAGQQVAPSIAYAVVLHRLPEGLMVFSLVRPAFGGRIALISLMSLAAATLAGYFLGSALSGTMSSEPMGLFLGLVGGALLHVVLHRPHPVVAAPPSSRLAEGFGGLLGGAMLWMLLLLESASQGSVEGAGHVHAMAEHGVQSVFWDLLLESAPALLLAYLIAGLVQAFLPKATVNWLSGGSPLTQSLRGMAFGLPLPLCSCGVIPVYRSLVLRGAPPAAAVAFLVATPELGLDAVLLSVPLLGVPMTGARVVCAALAAVAVGWWMGRLKLPFIHDESAAAAAAPRAGDTVADRVVAALRIGFGEMVDGTVAWILVGLLAAAVMAPALDPSWLLALPDPIEVLLCAALGMPMYVCASAATPLVAVLLAAGVSPGAGIAFLLAGPATNVTTFGVLSSLHGRRAALAFTAAMTFACIALGLAVNALLPDSGDAAFKFSADHSASALQWFSAFALAALFLASLLRQGPRGFVGQLSFFGRGHDHDHSHDDDHHSHDHHSHDHDHSHA